MKQSRERSIFLPLLAVSFITMRLCNVIVWPWVWVLCPIWGPWAIAFFVAVWVAIRREEKKRGKEKQSI